MLDRKHLERVLKINGVALDASEEVIRATLLNARYRDSEVDSALKLLHGGGTQNEGAHENGAEKLLRSDQVLSPQDISTYLGIDVDVSALKAQRRASAKSNGASVKEQAILIVAALSFGIISFVAAMYFMEFGVFHPTAAIIFYER